MTRGSTSTQCFELPFDVSVIKTIEITYSQKKAVRLRKMNEDCTFEGATVTLKLSQEDTFIFDPGDVEIQIRVLTLGGEVVPSKSMYVYCHDSRSDEVLE